MSLLGITLIVVAVFLITGSIVGLLVAMGVVVIKGRVDNIQEHAAEMAAVVEYELGLEGMADFLQKVAVGKGKQARKMITDLWKRYGTKEKIHQLIAKLAFKAFPKLARHKEDEVRVKAATITAALLPAMLDDPKTAPIVQQAIIERILGMLLTPEIRTELATLGPFLSEYGSVEFAQLVVAMGVGDVATVRNAARSLGTVLRNRDQLDDELVKRAIKGIPRAIQADPRHWATLNDVVTKAKPPAAA